MPGVLLRLPDRTRAPARAATAAALIAGTFTTAGLLTAAAAGTRPAQLHSDPTPVWTHLENLRVPGGAIGDHHGPVEFRAHRTPEVQVRTQPLPTR
jgi:hypothetical protein